MNLLRNLGKIVVNDVLLDLLKITVLIQAFVFYCLNYISCDIQKARYAFFSKTEQPFYKANLQNIWRENKNFHHHIIISHKKYLELTKFFQ